MDSRAKLNQILENFGYWPGVLENVVSNELIPDFNDLRQLLSDPNSTDEQVGSAILEIGFRLRRVMEKYEEVKFVYTTLYNEAPELIQAGKKYLSGK